MYTGTSAE